MKVELFMWVLALILVELSSAAEGKPSTKHKETKEKHWWDDWGEWFPEEKDDLSKKHQSSTKTVPDLKDIKKQSLHKKDSDFSFDKSLSLKDNVDQFVDDNDVGAKVPYLKKEEKGDKDWHAEFDKSLAYHVTDDLKKKDHETKEEKSKPDKDEIFQPSEGGSDSSDKTDDDQKVPSGYNSFDSIIPDNHPIKETDEKETIQEEYHVYHTKHESVKKDLANPNFLKEFANTKPDLNTSPNPPPPGLGDGKPSMVTPAVRIVLDINEKSTLKKIHIKSYIKSVPAMFCKTDYDCKAGRMCHDGVCMCLPDSGCLKHNHPVCGSDGIWYPSHCELHRTACIRRVHIKVDRKSCVKQDEDTPAHVVKKPKLKKPSDVDAPIDPKLPSGTIIDSKEIYVGNYLKKKLDNSANKLLKKEDKEKTPEFKKNLDWKKVQPVKNKSLSKKCDFDSYLRFKEKLLLHHCNRFAEPDCHKEVQRAKDREYLATLIFSYYDRDIDYYLETEDLEIMQKKEELVILDSVCTLLDMLVYDDVEPKDNKLSVNEFFKAFDKEEQKGSLEIDFQIIPTLATVGNGLELKCAIMGGNGDIIWKRYDTEIKDSVDGLTVFDDGSLFFSRVGVHHIGNYSCTQKNTNIRQIHVLKVQMPPVVKVSPVSQLHLSDTDITVKCHTEGIPPPVITWQINEMSLPDDPKHFQQTDNNETLTIHNADFHRDTGAYKCVAKNQAGKGEDVASIFIRDIAQKKLHSSPSKTYGTFLVFHSRGYTAYRPQTCLMRREVNGKFGNFKFIPDNLVSPLRLCEKDHCDWGTAVNVKDEFVFVSQPSQNRIVVIDTAEKWNPIQVVETDRQPIGLYYVKHLDQVWVLCWNGRDDGSMKTIVVIRDASQAIQHHAVHTQPVGNRFDLVEQIFLPPSNDLQHNFNFGYIVHSDQRGLFKLDLIELKYLKVVDFSQFDCVPKSLAYVPIGGHVMVECVVPSSHKTLQINIDYITDTIISHTVLSGRPFVSPDSRHLVTVDYSSGKVCVSSVGMKGEIEMGFEVIVSTMISDVEFFPAPTRKGYDFIISSAENEDVIILSLNNGKVEKIKGTHKIDGDVPLAPIHSVRDIVSAGIFGEYFIMPFDSTISIIDGKYHHVKCEFKGVLQSKGIVFVEN